MGRDLAITSDTAAQAACNLCGSHSAEHLFTKKGYRLVQCCDCGLAFIANPPDAAGIAAIYDVAASYHDQLLDPESEDHRRQLRVAHQHLKMLRRFRPQLEGLRLLDIGCSSGIFLSEASAHGVEGEGAELSRRTAEFARTHFGLPIHPGDWREAGYGDASFDIVTLFDVIEHLPDPMQELRDIRRLLKPGGLLLQSTPDIEGLFPRISQRFAGALDYWPHPEPPHHLFQFSEATLAAMVEKAGYRTTGAHHVAIDFAYNFGTPAHWKVSPKMLAYAAAFAPVAVVGNYMGQGDWLYLGATRD
ncbi:class I SAM-dependent methyltransferase [Aurantiacibacter luteus]|uniref:Uncharacterized protein n=1 Tax=Aurantiacibacter luteus TaxID=1581420 RepID=A0A0G9MXK8_9SPHN|nr:class I SAM-dependent methyltransferase [Aurantiacibacter luteus]KLE35522.1 hypothetical protein AAW00_03605 [Aurantiacibacter luteus]